MAEGQRRILVLEDDRETAEQLVDSLSNSGYHVNLAIDGDDGLRRGRCNEYAVMTIDRILPGLDGLIVLRRLREDGIVTPALILSALGGTDDRVHGLRAGGDDYLVSRTASRSGREIAGQVVPRAMLLQHVWNLNFDPTTTSSMSRRGAGRARCFRLGSTTTWPRSTSADQRKAVTPSYLDKPRSLKFVLRSSCAQSVPSRLTCPSFLDPGPALRSNLSMF
jgi:CheY-like chemotaxis protein